MKRDSLRLYGIIGNDIFGDGQSITSSQVADDLGRLEKEGVKALDVYLSSDGGNVAEGLTIYSQLRRYPGDVSVTIDGRAVSIASVIALAGKRLTMPSSALMMIHSPFIMALGNANELRKVAADLDVMAKTMRDIYAEKSGLPAEKVQRLMDDETWMNAQQAKDLGFVDDIADGKARAIAQAPRLLDLYKNTPAALRGMQQQVALAKLNGLVMRQRMADIARSASAAAAGQDGGGGRRK